MTNLKFSVSNKTFKMACKIADTPVTQRQASKYRMKKGIAYPFHTKAFFYTKFSIDNEV